VSTVVETCLEEERHEQRSWRLKPQCAGLRRFDRLVENEFISPEEQRARQDRKLAALVEFCVSQVPYYRDLFEGSGLVAGDVRGVDDLVRLPVLVRNEVIDQADRIRPAALPSSESIFGRCSSSGTTGRPVSVLMTHRSNMMFTLAVQRQYRWYRYDPSQLIASITTRAEKLPWRKDGTPYPLGTTYQYPRWRYAGVYFETGDQVEFAMDNTVEDQFAWLQRQRPVYLTSNSQELEHLAYVCEGDWPVDSIKSVISIATQMTPAMSRMITQTMNVQVHENYGFNEIGVVALRCAAGRYHVMSEHCVVEIIDDEGHPVAPGHVGRLVISTLTNMAMPLIRYDAGDLAKAVDGPCSCGRTLPAFGELIGRYRRTAFLPEGTLQRRAVLSEALAALPAELSRPIRKYQLHQYRDQSFEFRVVAVRPLENAFKQWILAAWQGQEDAASVPLVIVQVDDIERGPGGKFQDFTSDFNPAPDGLPDTETNRGTPDSDD